MTSITKLFIAIVSLSLFDVALMDDIETDQFLLDVGDQCLADRSFAGENIDAVITNFEEGKFHGNAQFKASVFSRCQIHWRNLIVKQLLQIADAWRDDTKRYLGCIAATGQISEPYNEINMGPHDGYTYFSPDHISLRTLLQSVGSLIGQQGEPDQATRSKFALASSHSRTPANAAILSTCRQLLANQGPLPLRDKACNYIHILLAAIQENQQPRKRGRAGPGSPSQ